MPFQDRHNSYSPAQGSLEMKMDAKWMDRQSYYVQKRIGSELVKNPFWPVIRDMPFQHEQEFVSKAKLEWVDEGTEYVFKGDRMSGLSLEKGRGRVSIKEEVIDNRRLWVVDIEQPTEARHKGYTCNGCRFVSRHVFTCVLAFYFSISMYCLFSASNILTKF